MESKIEEQDLSKIDLFKEMRDADGHIKPDPTPTMSTICSDFGKLSTDPTQIDPETGIKYDFNYGARIKTPDDPLVKWRFKMTNLQTGSVLVDEHIPPASMYMCPKKYYIPYKVEVTSLCGRRFTHVMNLREKTVSIKIVQRTLGDPIALFSYVPVFKQIHGISTLIVHTAQRIKEIFEKQYPDITFKTLEEEDHLLPYATYYLGLFFDETFNFDWQPYDFRTFGLHRQGGHILGISKDIQLPPEVDTTRPSPIAGKYVAIAVQGSKQCKVWNNPTGWLDVVRYLGNLGYTVVCIDREPVCGSEYTYNAIPNGVIDLTGDKPLQERIDVIKGADMFIGTASGLSWLAWCCKVPVIMISGFSLPFAEFDTPHRVINTEAPCIGCWNDTRITFKHHENFWCPRVDAQINDTLKKKYTTKDGDAVPFFDEEIDRLKKKKFICTKAIQSAQVVREINVILELKKRKNKEKKA